jgi:phosphoribosylformylglycinamidine synthase
MALPHVLILRAPGTNCDQETAFAFERAGGRASRVHINQLLAEPRMGERFQILCVPGGFSYGDDIAAGRILANQIRHHLADVLHEFQQRKLVLGICNGFQVLIKTGLLVPEHKEGAAATLTWNDSGRFEYRWVRLRSDGRRCVFLRDIETMYLPVAHAEGKFVTRSDGTLRQLDANGQLVLRYANETSDAVVDYPANPNGSQAQVAGICDLSGRVLGLMPHPERHIDPTHHPRWTRRAALPPEGDGLAVFRNAVSYFL